MTTPAQIFTTQSSTLLHIYLLFRECFDSGQQLQAVAVAACALRGLYGHAQPVLCVVLPRTENA